MQSPQDYIESGLLEQYALGELDPPAQAAVEAQAAQHPEVAAELARIQSTLEAFANLHAVSPPPAMRERVLTNVLARIARPAGPSALSTSSSLRADVDAVAGRLNGHSGALAPLRDTAPVAGRTGRLLWAIAASVALLVSLGGNVLLYNNWQDAHQNLVALEDRQARYAATTQASQRTLQRDLAGAMQENLVLRDDSYKAVALAGTPQHPTAHARVLFNATSNKVYVDVQHLPALPAGQQYQLWALDKGQPVDAGVLATTTAAGDSLQQMKNIASAQAFAMTVEPVGGSRNPTLNTMTVMGAI